MDSRKGSDIHGISGDHLHFFVLALKHMTEKLLCVVLQVDLSPLTIDKKEGGRGGEVIFVSSPHFHLVARANGCFSVCFNKTKGTRERNRVLGHVKLNGGLACPTSFEVDGRAFGIEQLHMGARGEV